MRTVQPRPGWTWSKVKHLADFFTGWTPPTGDAASFEGDNLWANISDLGERVLQDTAKRISDEAVARSAIRLSTAGSLLFSFKLSIGQVSFAGRDLYTNEAIATFPPNKGFNPRWAYWAFPVFVPLNANENIYGAKLLNQELIRAADVLVPPEEEQERIANFLDQQTAQIDVLIAEKEKLLKLLAEHRLSVCERVISDADKRGRAKLGFLAELLPGFPFPSEKFSRDSEAVPLLRGINVTPGGLRWDETVYWKDELDPGLSRFLLRAGDVVFGMDRPWIASGARVAIVPPESEGALLLQRVCRLRGHNKLRQRFIYYALASDMFRQSIEVDLTGVSVPHISPEQILRFKVPVLTLEEQDARCASADAEDQRIKKLEIHTCELLERLREYRSSLIAAAVTGQWAIDDKTMWNQPRSAA